MRPGNFFRRAFTVFVNCIFYAVMFCSLEMVIGASFIFK